MTIQKWNPWNWFKHEESDNTQSTRSSLPQKQDSTTAADPFFRIHQEMDRVFSDVFNDWPGMWPLKPFTGNLLKPTTPVFQFFPKLNLSSDEKNYNVSLEVPGLLPSDVHVDIHDRVLQVHGKKEVHNETKEQHYFRQERSSGEFSRTLSLPDDANIEDIKAKMENGVLSLQIPRKATEKPNVKQIPIH